ncbi:hypothetical protein HPP92_003272 [Vanilla planifolia]|nr:hypothetical protein HPP92_003272 [Vanilla planifolia]
MARFVARGIAVASSCPLLFSSAVGVPLFRLRRLASEHFWFATSSQAGAPFFSIFFPLRNHLSISACSRSPLPSKCSGESVRGYRKGRWRRRRTARKKPPKESQPELNVMICIEEDLPEDPDIKSIAEILRMDLPMAMALAFSHLDVSHYKTRDTAVNDVNKFEKIKISLLLCNDDFIRRLNKEWRDEDHATDVLSMSQHIPELNIPILMLGDIVISIDTASRQAVERAHTLLDEMRILMVHGLLHLLGFDHEISDEAEEEMEKEEELILAKLGWKGKGLIKSAYDSHTDGSHQAQDLDV